MGAISSWLLSIAGVVILSVLSELVLPEGQINKYTKVIFSFAILLVIIMPLPKLFGKNFDISKFFGQQSELQEDYLYQLNLDKVTALSDDFSKKVESEGMKRVKISINANILSEKLEIFSVYVDLCDIEYTKEFGNMDIARAKIKILDIAKSFELLKDVEVRFNE